jgi:hypothetical protein
MQDLNISRIHRLGRREFRGGDLRERLQRRQSPRAKRFSPGRDSRGRQNRGMRFNVIGPFFHSSAFCHYQIAVIVLM